MKSDNQNIGKADLFSQVLLKNGEQADLSQKFVEIFKWQLVGQDLVWKIRGVDSPELFV